MRKVTVLFTTVIMIMISFIAIACTEAKGGTTTGQGDTTSERFMNAFQRWNVSNNGYIWNDPVLDTSSIDESISFYGSYYNIIGTKTPTEVQSALANTNVITNFYNDYSTVIGTRTSSDVSSALNFYDNNSTHDLNAYHMLDGEIDIVNPQLVTINRSWIAGQTVSDFYTTVELNAESTIKAMHIFPSGTWETVDTHFSAPTVGRFVYIRDLGTAPVGRHSFIMYGTYVNDTNKTCQRVRTLIFTINKI